MRDGSGIYTYPPGTPGVAGQTIFSARYNTFLDDLATTLNTVLPINMGGTGASTAATGPFVQKGGDTMTGPLGITATTTSGVSLAVAANANNWAAGFVNSNAGASANGIYAKPGADANMGLAVLNAAGNALNFSVTGAGNVSTAGNVSASSVTSSGEIKCTNGNLYTYGIGGNVNSGAVRFSSDGNKFLYNDGTNFIFSTGNVSASSFSTVGAVSIGGSGVLQVNSINQANSIYGNIVGPVLDIVNYNSNSGANGIKLRLSNDAAWPLAVINAAQNQWTFYVTGGGNVACSGSVSCGPIIAAGAIQTAGDVIVGYTGNNGVIRFGNNGNNYLWWNGSQFNLNGGLLSTSHLIQSNFGYQCKNGQSGGFGGNVFNIVYAGAGGVHCWIDATDMGQISFVSDYRTKKDVADLPSTWDTVKALRPIKYTQAEYAPPVPSPEEKIIDGPDGPIEQPPPPQPTEPLFKADNIERWGFIAHELQETMIPTAATAYKDAPDAVQSPNPWTMLAAVTRALQEAMARIEALEAKVA